MNDLLMYLFVAAFILVVAGPFAYSVLAREGTNDAMGSAQDQARVIAELGPVRHTYTNYTPWRARAGVAMLLVGLAAAAAATRPEVPGGVKLLAGAGILFGTVTLIYAFLMRIDRLVLHTRGLVLYRGRRDAKAVYYADIRSVGYDTVTYTTNGVAGTPIAKGIAISLYTGGELTVGNDFVKFSVITSALEECIGACRSTEPQSESYLISGYHQFEGTREEIVVEARSPEHAREVALSRHGVVAEECKRVK